MDRSPLKRISFDISQQTRLWLYYISICSIVVTTNLEITMVSVGLPSIIADLNLTVPNAHFLMNTFLMSAVSCFILFGQLGDQRGHHNVMVLGMICFLIGTITCSISQSSIFFFLGRFLQGLGFSSSFVMAIVLINKIFPEEKKSFYLGITTAISGLTQAIGPYLSGYIIENMGWRSIFIVKIPVVVFGLLICLCLNEGSFFTIKKNKNLEKYYIFTLLFFVFQFIFSTFFLLAAFVAVTIFFKRKFILAKLKFLKNDYVIIFQQESFMKSLFIRANSMFYFSTILFLLPLYLSYYLNYNVVDTSINMFFLSVSYTISSFIYAFVSRYKNIGIYTSLFFQILGVISFSVFIIFQQNEMLIISCILSGISFGICVPQSIQLAFQKLSHLYQGLALGLFFTTSFLASLVAVNLSGSSLLLKENISIVFSEKSSFECAFLLMLAFCLSFSTCLWIKLQKQSRNEL